MSNFINTEKKDVINSLIEGYKQRLNNPYYINFDNPTPTTYYNTNMNKTTLGIGSKLAFSELGTNSPIRYNKIEDFFIYGLDKLMVQLDNGEYGLESDPVQGEGIILPNTIVPIPNDYFSINYLDKKVLFRVTDVTPDTLNNGSNFYRISYRLDQLDESKMADVVVDSFHMLINNVGSQLNTVIRSDEYKFIEKMEEITQELKLYYIELFYSTRVETFIWSNEGVNFYDPFMVEFLIRNKLIKNNKMYLYVTHQCFMPQTFALEYNKSFFRCIENKKFKSNCVTNTTADLVEDPLSILTSRQELYYKLNYRPPINIYFNIIQTIDPVLLENIKDKKLFEGEDYRNIIIKYFYGEDITLNDLDCLEDTDFESTMEYFYNIPFLIFILEHIILQLLKKG